MSPSASAPMGPDRTGQPPAEPLRSWTHETDAAPVAGTGVFPDYVLRFEKLTGGFSPEELHRRYPSDGHGGHQFIPLLDGFDELLAHHPEVFELDRAKVIAINNAAQTQPERRRLALHTQYEDQILTVHPGLGRTLGRIFLDAMLEGRLPRTFQLLSKYRPNGRVAHYGASCNPAKAHWADRSPRPYLHAPDELKYFDVEGGQAHAGLDGSFPSGHTSEAFWQGVTLASLLPELAPGILARTADSGHFRVVMGAHYPLDVIGGRIMGTYIAANRWSDAQFRPLLYAARQELVKGLEQESGLPLHQAAAADEPYLPYPEARRKYRKRMTYGFPAVAETGQKLTVPAEAPDLLRTAHPGLSYRQRARVLELTALDSGYPLDKSGPFGGWQRLDLLAAMTVGALPRGGDIEITDPLNTGNHTGAAS